MLYFHFRENRVSNLGAAGLVMVQLSCVDIWAISFTIHCTCLSEELSTSISCWLRVLIWCMCQGK